MNQIPDPEVRAWILEVSDNYLKPPIKHTIKRYWLDKVIQDKPSSGFYNSDHELVKRINQTIALTIPEITLIENFD